MDATQFVTLVLTTGVVTTLMNVAYSEFKEWRGRRRQVKRVAGFLALQTAVALEAYVDQCCDFVETMRLDAGVEGEPSNTTLPAFPGLPDTQDDGWRELILKLAARCLAFPNQVSSAQAMVRLMDKDEDWRQKVAEREPVNPDRLPGDVVLDGLVEKESLKLARDAWLLAADLRSAYRLPKYVAAYDTLEWIEESLEQAERLEAIRADARRWFVGLFKEKVGLMPIPPDEGQPQPKGERH